MRHLVVVTSVVHCLAMVAAVDEASAQAGAQAGAQRLSLAEAEKVAIRQNTAVAMARTAITGAEERVEAARASRLPRVSIDANVLFWDREQLLEFDVPIPGLELDPTVVRERVTSTASLTVAQPLTPQIALHHLVALERAGLAATRQEWRQTEIEVAYRAADGYLLVLLARAAGDIAALRVDTLATQLERARALVDGGLLQPVDVMRLEAAQAMARQEVIRSRSQAQVASGSLALILGMPPGQSVEVVDTFPDEPGAPRAKLDDAVGIALSGRPDLTAVGHRITQAERGASVARAQLYPTVVAVGTLQHNEGMGMFQPENTWFLGVNLQWDVWDWGQRRHSYKEAAATAERAKLGARQLHDQVRIEVEAAVEDATSAYESLAVARIGLTAAEEAFRIQTAQYEEGAATTTDLLNAQTEVTQARLGYATARYAYFRALVALARATGQLPTAVLSTI